MLVNKLFLSFLTFRKKINQKIKQKLILFISDNTLITSFTLFLLITTSYSI